MTREILQTNARRFTVLAFMMVITLMIVIDHVEAPSHWTILGKLAIDFIAWVAISGLLFGSYLGIESLIRRRRERERTHVHLTERALRRRSF